MNGRPFRIAAAGLGTALVASIVAGVSHFRTETRLLAAAGQLPIPSASIAASASPESLEPMASVASASAASSPDETAVVASIPEPGPVVRPSARTATVVSNIRRKKEFVELPPPPEFLEEPEPPAITHTAAPSSTSDSRLAAEIASLRSEFDRLAHQQQVERQLAREHEARTLAEMSTERRLAELKSSIDELKRLEADRRLAVLQTESALPVLERPTMIAQAEPEKAVVRPEQAASVPASAPWQNIAITEGDSAGQFHFEIHGAELPMVLAQIGVRGGMNIVVSPDIQGTVTAQWKNLSPQAALEALRLAHGLAVEPQGEFLLVTSSADAKGRSRAAKNTLVQMFRPLYISGRDLLPLIQPLLTPEIGRVAVTLPQSTNEAERALSGGDSLAQPDAIVVVDYPEVIEVVTRTIAELDIPAPHVELEATILDVQLSGRVKNGVSALVASGEFSTRPGFASLDDPQAIPCDAGCQTCEMSSAELVDRLKLWTDVKLVSSARVLVLNKQPAELQVGSESLAILPTGTRSPSAAVDSSTRLFVRPFVSADHLVRLEVSPEAVTSRLQPMNTRRESFASVATNVAVPNGGTLVIAGLNADQSVAPSALFESFGRLRRKHRDQADRSARRELVIMITPRIVADCPPLP